MDSQNGGVVYVDSAAGKRLHFPTRADMFCYILGSSRVAVAGPGPTAASAPVYYFRAREAGGRGAYARAALVLPYDRAEAPVLTVSNLFTGDPKRVTLLRGAVVVAPGGGAARWALPPAAAKVSRADIQFGATACGLKVCKVWVAEWGVNVFLDPELVDTPGVPVQEMARLCGAVA